MENFQELTECCICTDTFTDPRILPCIHTFCLKCLQQTAVKNGINAGGKMHCPFCRREFVIPTEGMSGLQKNFFMNRLVELTKLSKTVEKVTLCEICSEENETEACDIPTATNYCVQCRKNICNLCCQCHKKFQDLKDHVLLPLGSQMKDELIRKNAVQSCDKHSKEKSKMFCSDCKEVICMMCFAENHQLHKCSDIEASADSFRQQILDTIQRVNSFSKDFVLKSEKLLREQSDFLKNVEREETAVVTRGKILKDLVDKCTQSLLDELNSIKLSHLKERESEKEENEFHKGILESFKEYCRELASKGSAAEICRSAFNINNREAELKQLHENFSQKQITSVEVSFEPLNLEELLKTENVVGKIKVERKFEAEEREDEQNKVSILSSVELDMPPGYVKGVTKLLHNIYILSWSPFASRLYVFDDQSPFRLQREIKINEIKNPLDMTAIGESKCLFVTDSQNLFDSSNSKSFIWKITTDDHRVTKWVTNVETLYSMSAYNDGHLLIITKDQASRNYLKIYKSDARLSCSLLLPIAIQDPFHFIQTSNGDFIIGHRNGQAGPWVISRLTSDGKKIICRCNLTEDRVSQKLNYPQRLALDSDKNRLFVAESDRVSVFGSNSLILIKVLLTQEKFKPYRLHYDAKKRQLIVAQSPEKVNIYEIN